jgi:hypothetical protein
MQVKGGVRLVNGVLYPQVFIATKARLDLVVFEDGSFIGEDSQGSIETISARLKAIAKTGQMALAGQWDDLLTTRIIPGDRTSADLRAYGYQLAWTRDHKSEAEALKLASICTTLPAVLRRPQ